MGRLNGAVDTEAYAADLTARRVDVPTASSFNGRMRIQIFDLDTFGQIDEKEIENVPGGTNRVEVVATNRLVIGTDQGTYVIDLTKF